MGPPKKSPIPPWLAFCCGIHDLGDEPPKHTPKMAHKPAAACAPPKKPTKPKSDWREIPLVKQYALGKRIGKGGFSEVWRSEHRETKEVVAIKVVQLANASLEPDEIANLLAEAKFLRTLDCPFLLKCHDTTHNSDWLVLVLEYLNGGEMFEHIHKVKKYTEVDAAKLFSQVVSAISYLHNLNLIHRDIKPENIMFTSPVEACEAEGRPLRLKVIDLGMAMQYSDKKAVTGCVGTPGFVSPEVWNNKPHTFALDVYALGVVLFIMLTGRKPHSGMDIRKMHYCNKSIKDAPGLVDDRFLALSAPARELVLQMLSDDPRDRPSCMAVLRHPFITADEANAEAHREMGDVVRQRMRDLAKLRRLHGLRYAINMQRKAGTSQAAFLEALDRRRLKLKGERERDSFQRDNSSGFGVDGSAAAGRAASGGAGSAGGGSGHQQDAGGGGTMRRSSLWLSYGDGDEPGTAPNGAFGSNGVGGCGYGRNSARPSTDGPGNGSASSNTVAAVADKLALLVAMPEMARSNTMPARRFESGTGGLSPVASCDPSYYNCEDAALGKGWSAYPAMYEALQMKDVLLDGLAPAGPPAMAVRVGGPPAPLSAAQEQEEEEGAVAAERGPSK